jgi:flagellar biosynthesis protein FlhG
LQPAASGPDIHAVSRAIGIEPSRIRFYEAEFKEFFDAAISGGQRTPFDEARVTLLREIDRLVSEEGLDVDGVRKALRRARDSRSRVLQVVSVTSGKGGVGKTTVSIGLAIAFARRGLRTLLFDADLGLGNVHVMAGIQARGTVVDWVEGRASLEQIISNGPGNIKVVCAGSGVARMADLDPAVVHRLGHELTRLTDEFDVIVIDTSAGISAQVIHFLRMADHIVLVATPDLSSMLDAYGVVKVSREAGIRQPFHVLVNLVEEPGQPALVYERISSCARRFLTYAPGYLGHLQRDPAIQECNRLRTPLSARDPDSIPARCFDQYAAVLGAAANPRPEAAEVPLGLLAAATAR